MTARLRTIALAGLAALAAIGTAAPATAATVYQFTSFDGPGDIAGGTTVNGINNNGLAVGFTTDANGVDHSFTFNTRTGISTVLTGLATGAQANGINAAGTIVGGAGTNAFIDQGGSVNNLVFFPGTTSAVAFGINDGGTIVGQFTGANGNTPGFINNGITLPTINAPAGTTTDVVNAQGINNNGLVVGFYVGNDGQQHGFIYTSGGGITAVADPTIPPVAGEPGATFVFSQILAVNDSGLAVGYYGDSTTSQHGFLYNTKTGQYTFLDSPFARFTAQGVEITQITGITNSGEITGFYTDATGLQHGFYANAVPEPGTMALTTLGLAGMVGVSARRRLRRKGA